MKHCHSLLLPLFWVSLFCFILSSCTQPQPRAKHLVIIGWDGLSSSAYRNADMPFMKASAEQGAYALKKRSCLPSKSSINWMTMLSGSCPELHGFLQWGTKEAELEQRQVAESGCYPTLFTLMHAQRPDARIAFFYDWDVMKCICDSNAISEFHFCSSWEMDSLTQMAVDYFATEAPELTFFEFSEPDESGHKYGWESPEYMQALHRLDSCTQVLVEATKKTGMYDDCIFVIISDHGGIDTNHGGSTMQEMEAPFIVWGKNIRPIGCLDKDYSMMNFDVGTVLADICGVTPPQIWTGRSCFPIFTR